MEIPGMNPLQNRPVMPGQGQQGVPDLILDGPKGRMPAQQAAAAPTQAPYQAPAQAMVQHSLQNMTTALMEMNIPPTPQNVQMAQLLANYGHAVNSHTMGVFRQAMLGVPDKSAASMEAVMVLLTQDLPVTEKNLAAIKQFMHGQPLPQQMQNLPKELGNLLQQMQQTAQTPVPTTPAAGQTAGQATAQTAAQAATQNAAQSAAQSASQMPQTAQQATPATGQAAATATQATAQSAQPVAQSPVQVAGQPLATAPATPQANAQTPAQLAGQLQNPAQGATVLQSAAQATALALAQNIQSGQSLLQAAPLVAAAQQFAGQAQALENKADGMSRIADKSTAQRVDMEKSPQGEIKAVEAVDGKHAGARQSAQVAQHLPAQQRDQQALHQLYLSLQGKENVEFQKIGPSGQQSMQSPEEAVLQLLKVLQDLAQISAHLSENMQLRNFNQLGLQHQQIIQLTGLLEAKLREFQQLFGRAFPGLNQEIQRLLQQDGQDMFSRLAQLIDEHQVQLKEKLLLPGSQDEKALILLTLRQLMEQVGFQVEKIQAHLGAREMLIQNLPCHCIPLMIHYKGEAHTAELYIQQDYDPQDPDSGPDAKRPLKIVLTLETHHLGRVSVDMSTLQTDMMLDLQVLTRRVKLLVDARLDELRYRLENEGPYQLSQLNCRVVPDLETRQSMLLPTQRSVRSLRRVEGVV